MIEFFLRTMPVPKYWQLRWLNPQRNYNNYNKYKNIKKMLYDWNKDTFHQRLGNKQNSYRIQSNYHRIQYEKNVKQFNPGTQRPDLCKNDIEKHLPNHILYAPSFINCCVFFFRFIFKWCHWNYQTFLKLDIFALIFIKFHMYGIAWTLKMDNITSYAKQNLINYMFVVV